MAHPSSAHKMNRLHYALFTIPGAVFLLALAIYPFAELIWMSLSTVAATNIIRGSWPFVGIQNFTKLFHLSDFGISFANTLEFVAIVVSVGMAGGLGAAAILQPRTRLAEIAMGLLVFIWAMPPVVLGSLWKFLLLPNGLVNAIITGLGIAKQGPLWLVKGNLVLVSVALVNAWAAVPFSALVYRAALVDIPLEIVDAAEVDGASRFQTFFMIKMPLLMPITLILTVLTAVYAFRSFDFIYVMTYGGPGSASTTMPFLSYLLSFVQFNYSLGSAVAVFTILVVVGLVLVYVRATRRTEET